MPQWKDSHFADKNNDVYIMITIMIIMSVEILYQNFSRVD